MAFLHRGGLLLLLLAVLLGLTFASCGGTDSVVSTTTTTSSSSNRYAFPIPTDPTCNSYGSRRVCNPDDLLTQDDIQLIDDAIARYEDNNHHRDLWCRGTKQQQHYDVQFGVYIEKDITVSTASNVRNTAKKIHNEWGVGYQLDDDCGGGGGTGMLLYLVVDDHRIYLSRGGALHDTFSDQNLHDAINGMYPWLQQGQYGDAIRTAILYLSEQLNPTTTTTTTGQNDDGWQTNGVRGRHYTNAVSSSLFQAGGFHQDRRIHRGLLALMGIMSILYWYYRCCLRPKEVIVSSGSFNGRYDFFKIDECDKQTNKRSRCNLHTPHFIQ